MVRTLIRKYAEGVVRWRWLVLLLTIAATGWLGSHVAKLKLDNDSDLWAPQHHEFIKATHKLEKLFGGRNVVVIGLVPKKGNIYKPKILAKIAAIQKNVESLPEAIKHNVISLAAKRVKDISGNEDGMVVRDMLDRIPASEAEFDLLRRAIARNPLYDNALVSPDGTAAAIIADFRVSGENAAYIPLYEKLRAITDREEDGDVDILLGGPPIEAANFEYAMEKMPIYFGIAFLIIMSVQYLAFRSLQGVLLPIATAIMSVLWGLGALALTGTHMDALNTTTPILIMAVATGHACQILKRYYEELSFLVKQEGLDSPQIGRRLPAAINRLAVVQSLVNVGPVMLTAGTIAAITFFSLQISDTAMLRNFGFFAGAGILSVLAIEFTFIPALRSILPAKVPTARPADAIDKLLDSIGRILTRPKASRFVLISVAILIAVLGAGVKFLKVDNSARSFTAPDSPIRQDSTVLNSKFGGTDSILFLIEGTGPDSIKDPKVLTAINKLQTFLASQQHVGKTQSIADLIRRMNQAMHNDEKAYDVIPTDQNLIAQYLLLYSLSGQPDDFENLVDHDYHNAVVWVMMKNDSTAYAASLWKKCQELIKREFPADVHVRIGGGLPQIVAINDSLVDTKVKSVLQMAVVVFLLSSLALGSMVGGLLVVVPLMAIMLINFGTMGWMGASLDMGAAAIVSMVVGIGADYEIYMLFRLREEYSRCGDLHQALRTSLTTSGKAVLFVALSIAGGYSALLISDFLFYPRLATTMIGTMLTSAILSLVFLRAVIAVIQPLFIVNRRRVRARSTAAQSAIVLLFALGLLLAQPKASDAADPAGPMEVMEKNFLATKVSGFTACISLLMTNSQGQERIRKLTAWSKIQPRSNDTEVIMRFAEPLDIRGTGFLQIEHSAGEDDVWIFLPALGKVRRMVSANKRDSFFGTDFSYGDVLLPAADRYKHLERGVEVIDGADCLIIESTPLDEKIRDDSGYSRKLIWLAKDNKVERKVEYYDLTGTLLKTQTTYDVREVESNPQRWMPMRRKMVNHQTGHQTVFQYEAFALDQKIPEALFTTRNLQRQK